MSTSDRNALFLKPFFEAVRQNAIDVHAIVVHRHGERIGRHHFRNLYRENVYSCSKSVVSLAFGIALGEGLVTLDDRITDVFPECVPSSPSPYLTELSMRHLLTMSAGFARDPLSQRQADVLNENWVKTAFETPIKYRPGTCFQYQNAPTVLISRAIEKKANASLLAYLKPRLFDPLGIPNPQWFTAPDGLPQAFSGLFLTPEEMAVLGDLILQNGRIQGRMLIPESYVREATSFRIDNRENRLTHEKDDTAGYGYFFWLGSDPGLVYASGVYGQQIFIFRELDTVISTTADIEEGDATQILLDLIRSTLLPELPA